MADYKVTACALVVLALTAASGCQSADGPAPKAFSEPLNTGEFPKIGHVPVGETAQLGADGAAALRSGLVAARATQSAVADAPESYREKLKRLRLLKARHAAETLAQIETRKPQ